MSGPSTAFQTYDKFHEVIEEIKLTGDTYPRYRKFADSTVLIGNGAIQPSILEIDTQEITDGEETLSRLFCSSNAVTSATQRLDVSFFTATRTRTASSVNIPTGATAAGATPTLIRFGIYVVETNGDVTLVASTPNDTTLLAAANTLYTKALSVPYRLVRGVRYGFARLVVTGAAAPSFNGGIVIPSRAVSPRLSATVAAQADLPASVVAGSLADAASVSTFAYLN